MTAERKRLGRDYFERLYADDPDPWNFETSEYERRKYAATLDALGDGHFRNALEIGCSIGVFTRMLGERCDALLAVDVSERAVDAARRRLEGLDNVTVERRTLPEEMPGGGFDLVVVSEVLYYLPEDEMLELLAAIEGALSTDGRLVAVHWRPQTRTYPLQGEEVHALISTSTKLRSIVSRSEPEYLLDVYGREPSEDS